MVSTRGLWASTTVSFSLALGVLGTVYISGCESIGGDGWTSEKKESAIDGQTITVSKDFATDDGITFLRVSLECIVKSKDAKVTVESYDKKEQQGQHEGSRFVTEQRGILKGRATLRNPETGASVQVGVSDLLALGEYSNKAVLDGAAQSVADWMNTEGQGDAFWKWAASVTPNRPANMSVDELAMKLAQQVQLTNYMATMAALGERGAQGATAVGVDDLVDEFLGYARTSGDVSTLAPADFIKARLPISLELFNGGGRFEVTIPADNSAINSALAKCAGSPWWERPKDVVAKPVGSPEAGATRKGKDRAGSPEAPVVEEPSKEVQRRQVESAPSEAAPAVPVETERVPAPTPTAPAAPAPVEAEKVPSPTPSEPIQPAPVEAEKTPEPPQAVDSAVDRDASSVPVGGAAATFAPSFDCAKASSVQERLICGNKELAELDVEANKLYARARQVVEDKEGHREFVWASRRRVASGNRFPGRLRPLLRTSGNLARFPDGQSQNPSPPC